jgi:predicted TIM-barrel fold metal-dependent hydrolase
MSGPRTARSEPAAAIDVHTHIGLGTDPYPPAKVDAYLERAAELGIAVSWISRPFTGVGLATATPELMSEGNRMVAEEVARHPRELRGYVFAHAGHRDWSIAEMDRWLDRPGMIGVKLYHQYLFDDPIVVPIVEAAARRGTVILLHQGKCSDDGTRASQPFISDGTHIARLAARVPEARLLCGHIGGGGDWEWTVKALKRTPSVCVDTSGSVVDAGMVEFAVRELGVERVLFATDLSLEEGVGKVQGAGLSEAERTAIFRGNAERLAGGGSTA